MTLFFFFILLCGTVTALDKLLVTFCEGCSTSCVFGDCRGRCSGDTIKQFDEETCVEQAGHVGGILGPKAPFKSIRLDLAAPRTANDTGISTIKLYSDTRCSVLVSHQKPQGQECPTWHCCPMFGGVFFSNADGSDTKQSLGFGVELNKPYCEAGPNQCAPLKKGGGSKTWVWILLVIFVLFAVGAGAFVYNKKKNSEYSTL